MTPTIVGMILMPASQVASWHLILHRAPLYRSICYVSSFYCAWALYNRFLGGQTAELGWISMGALAVASYNEHKNWTLFGTILVLMNYTLAAYIFFGSSAQALATMIKGSATALTLAWVWVFRVYILSNLALFVKVLDSVYHGGLYSSLPI